MRGGGRDRELVRDLDERGHAGKISRTGRPGVRSPPRKKEMKSVGESSALNYKNPGRQLRLLFVEHERAGAAMPRRRGLKIQGAVRRSHRPGPSGFWWRSGLESIPAAHPQIIRQN